MVPSDTANVLWTQPEDNQIFASFRDDVPASSSLFGAQPASRASGPPVGAHRQAPPPPAGPAATAHGAGGERQPRDEPERHGAVPATIQARTANQSICAG